MQWIAWGLIFLITVLIGSVLSLQLAVTFLGCIAAFVLSGCVVLITAAWLSSYAEQTHNPTHRVGK